MHYDPPNALLEVDTRKLWDGAAVRQAVGAPLRPIQRLALALANNTETVTLTLTADEARGLFDVLAKSTEAKACAPRGGRANARKFRRQNRK